METQKKRLETHLQFLNNVINDGIEETMELMSTAIKLHTTSALVDLHTEDINVIDKDKMEIFLISIVKELQETTGRIIEYKTLK